MHRRYFIAAACALIGAAFSNGCYDETRNRPGGSATITWTLQGQSSPLVCSRFGASSVEIRVVDAVGKVAGDTTTPCSTFRTNVALDAGEYRAELILLDDDGRPISDMARTRVFHIDAESRVVEGVHFPGCPSIFVPIPKCPQGKPVELRDAVGCFSGYDCAELSN